MKLGIFTSEESFVLWHEREIEAITKHGLRQAKEAYDKALRGEGKAAWLRMNNATLDSEGADEMWASYLAFCRDNVQYLERKIKRYQKKIDKYLAGA